MLLLRLDGGGVHGALGRYASTYQRGTGHPIPSHHRATDPVGGPPSNRDTGCSAAAEAGRFGSPDAPRCARRLQNGGRTVRSPRRHPVGSPSALRHDTGIAKG
ncbi:hypothetical protein GCM10023175_64110 [Pseudonocardia xishanensis]|uniref:Uncharacterized protein n=1 Tax=Pseudonocardia xishanensis TaxID=630995 RepID=A0ABP8S3Z7_9PSEU